MFIFLCSTVGGHSLAWKNRKKHRNGSGEFGAFEKGQNNRSFSIEQITQRKLVPAHAPVHHQIQIKQARRGCFSPRSNKPPPPPSPSTPPMAGCALHRATAISLAAAAKGSLHAVARWKPPEPLSPFFNPSVRRGFLESTQGLQAALLRSHPLFSAHLRDVRAHAEQDLLRVDV